MKRNISNESSVASRDLDPEYFSHHPSVSSSDNSEIEQTQGVAFGGVIFIPFNRYWQCVVGITTAFMVFASIYDYVYEFIDPPPLYTYIRYACDFIYLIDTVLFTLHRHMTAIQLTRVYLPKSKFLLFVDYISLIPMDLFYANVVIDKSGHSPNIQNMLRIKNVLRSYRLEVFYTDESSVLGSDSSRRWIIIGEFVLLQGLVTHVLAAVWYYMACKTDCKGVRTWVVNLEGKDFDSTSSISWFLWSFYFVAGIYAHAWGHDIRPENTSERTLVVVLIFIGYALTYALLYGRLIVANIEIDKRHFRFVEKMTHIKRFMTNSVAPKELQERTYLFYETFWRRRSAVYYAPFIKKLPLALQKEVNLDQFWEALVHSHLFYKMDVPFKRSLCLNMKSEILLPGDNVYQYGVLKTKMVYIVTGVVQILSDEDFESPIASFSSGTLLGELSIILPTSSTANVKCASYCEIHTLDIRGLFEALKNYPKKAKQLLAAIHERITFANKTIRRASLYGRQSYKLESMEMNKTTLHNETKWLKERSRRTYMKQSGDDQIDYENEHYWKTEAEKTQEEVVQHTSKYIDLYAFSDEVELKTDIVCIHARFPWILEPDSSFHHAWDVLMLVVVLAACMVIPYYVMTLPPDDDSFLPICIVFRTLYFIDIWIQCTTAIKTKDIMITDFCAITRYRLKQVSFLVDLITAIPISWVLMTMEMSENKGLALKGTINILLRVYKLFSYINKKESDLWIDIAVIRIIKYNLLYLITMYWTGAVLYMTACPQGYCKDLSWYGVGKKRDLETFNKLVDFEDNVVISLFYSFSLITTIGVSEVYPENMEDVVLCLFTILASLILRSHAFTELTATWITKSKPRVKYQSLIAEINRFGIENHLTHDLIARINNFLIFQWRAGHGSNMIFDEDLFHEAPQELRESISNFKINETLKQIPFFQDANPDFMKLVVKIAKCHMLPANAHLTVSGVRTTTLVIVRRGYCKVRSMLLSDIAEERIAFAGPGSHFPLIEFLHRIPVFVSVRCITCCEIISFEYRDFVNTMKLYGTVYKEVQQVLKQPDMDLTQLKCVQETPTENPISSKARDEAKLSAHTSNVNFFTENVDAVEKTLHEQQYLPPFLKLGRFHFLRFFLLRHGIPPESRFLKCWEVSRAFFAVCTLVVTPMIYCAMASYKELRIVGYFLDVTAYIDILLRFNVAYYTDTGILISHPLYTAHHYLTHAFSIDLLGCFPFKVIPVQSLFGNSSSALLLHLSLTISRGFQIYRFIGICKYLESDIRRVNDYITIFRLLVLLLLVWHYIANIVPFFKIDYIFDETLTFVGMKFPPYSWMYNAKLYDIKPEDTMELYVLAVCFAGCLFSSTMIGSFHINGVEGMTAFMIIGVIMCGMRLIFFSSISSMNMVGNINLTKYQERMRNFVSFLKNEDTHKDLLQKAINNFEHDWSITRGTNVYKVFSKFHAALHEDVTYNLYSSALKAVDIFVGADRIFFRSISKHVKVVHQKPGAVIIKFNQFEETVYIINRGIVIVQGTNIQGRGEMLQRGCLFGNLDIFKIPARYTAISYHTVELLAIPNTLLYSIMEDHEVIKKKFVTALGENKGYIGGMQEPDSDGVARNFSSSSQNLDGIKTLFQRIWTTDMLVHKIFTVLLNLILPYTSLMLVLFHIGLECNALNLRVSIYAIDVFYLLKIYFGFSTAYEDKSTGLLVIDLRRIAKRYVKSWFILDLISLLPLEVFALAITDPVDSLEASYWLKLNRMVRVFVLSEYFQSNLKRVNVSNHMRLVEAFVWNTLSIETMVCIYMMISCEAKHCLHTRSYFDETMVQTESFTEMAMVAQVYILAMYSGIGFKDVVPLRLGEVGYAILCVIAIQFVIAYTICCIASFIEITTLSKSNYRHDVLQLQDYQTDRDLSPYLRSKTFTYALQLWLRAKGEWLPVLLQEAPTYLREDLMGALYSKHLRHNMLFKGTHDDFLSQVTAKFDRCVFFPGDYIVEKGDVDGNMYFIHDGAVEVVHRNKFFVETLVETIRTNQVFSVAQGLYKNKPNIHFYRAKTVVDLLILNRNKCHESLAIFPAAILFIYGKAEEMDFTL